MQQRIRNLREAWGLLRSDDQMETVAALVILVWTLGPLAFAYYRLRRGRHVGG